MYNVLAGIINEPLIIRNANSSFEDDKLFLRNSWRNKARSVILDKLISTYISERTCETVFIVTR